MSECVRACVRACVCVCVCVCVLMVCLFVFVRAYDIVVSCVRMVYVFVLT